LIQRFFQSVKQKFLVFEFSVKTKEGLADPMVRFILKKLEKKLS